MLSYYICCVIIKAFAIYIFIYKHRFISFIVLPFRYFRVKRFSKILLSPFFLRKLNLAFSYEEKLFGYLRLLLNLSRSASLICQNFINVGQRLCGLTFCSYNVWSTYLFEFRLKWFYITLLWRSSVMILLARRLFFQKQRFRGNKFFFFDNLA